MHDKEITYFSSAIEKVRSEFYVDAINEYTQLIKEFPESELVDDALYNNYYLIKLKYFGNITSNLLNNSNNNNSSSVDNINSILPTGQNNKIN